MLFTPCCRQSSRTLGIHSCIPIATKNIQQMTGCINWLSSDTQDLTLPSPMEGCTSFVSGVGRCQTHEVQTGPLQAPSISSITKHSQRYCYLYGTGVRPPHSLSQDNVGPNYNTTYDMNQASQTVWIYISAPAQFRAETGPTVEVTGSRLRLDESSLCSPRALSPLKMEFEGRRENGKRKSIV